jgi:hypothetical protein
VSAGTPGIPGKQGDGGGVDGHQDLPRTVTNSIPWPSQKSDRIRSLSRSEICSERRFRARGRFSFRLEEGAHIVRVCRSCRPLPMQQAACQRGDAVVKQQITFAGLLREFSTAASAQCGGLLAAWWSGESV